MKMDSKDPLTLIKTSAPPNQFHNRKVTTSANRDKLQAFLAIWAALMMLGILIVFCLTNNPAVLLGTTVIGIAISLVYSFYFRNKS